MKGARGGRAASVPDASWCPPQRLLPDGEGTLVRFIEESGGASKVFDFSRLPATEEIQRWLARAFIRRTGPREGITRIRTAGSVYYACRWLVVALAAAGSPVRGPVELTGAHVATLVLRCAETRVALEHMMWLRSMLRDDPELPERARTVLLSARLPRVPVKQMDEREVAYSDEHWQQIMTAVRADVRRARDRIRAGQRLLARYRAGELANGSHDAGVAAVLDVFDRTGDVPRRKDGEPRRSVSRAGGVMGVASLLCLTLREATAFCLLLTALTAENFGTVAAWPASHHRPDGGFSDRAGPVALIEQIKARRGPEREHMVTALEDVPRGLADLLTGDDTDLRLMRSPLRVYRLLVELTEVSRGHGGHTGAVSACTDRPSEPGSRWVEGVGAGRTSRWARAHGFPAAGTVGDEAGQPVLDVRRIRQTGIEHSRHPVSHTRHTMNDRYLARSKNVRDDAQIVVAEALRDQVSTARSAQMVAVFTTALLTRFEHDPDGVAAEVGLEPAALRRLIAGEQDTAVTACTDHRSGPYNPPGQPCTASFLACLGCGNARALPHHLPVQLTMADRIRALEPHLDSQTWRARYQARLHQLEDILANYTAAEHAQARKAATQAHSGLVEDIVGGKWDLR